MQILTGIPMGPQKKIYCKHHRPATEVVQPFEVAFQLRGRDLKRVAVYPFSQPSTDGHVVDIVRDGLSAYSNTGHNYPIMGTFLPISETLVTLAILAVLIGVTSGHLWNVR